MSWSLDWTSTLRNVLLGAGVLGVVCGVLGSFTLLRRQSLLGDALAHAALPGVCVAFLITGAKTTPALFAGALVAGTLGALIVLAVVRGSKVKEDSAIGIVLSVFFGFGIVLLTYIQRLPQGNQSGLDSFLFGQAATLLASDVRLMTWIGIAVLAVVLLFYKEFKILSFDRAYAAALGLPVRRLEVLLTCLLVVVVVLGLQTVGVVLIVATLVTPAAAARQWTDRLGVMALLAAIIGGLSGAVGAVLSAGAPRLPTGPTIVLVASVVLVGSLAFSPRRGLLWAALRDHRLRLQIRRENLLKDMYRLGEESGAPRSARSLDDLCGMRGQARRFVARTLRGLAASGLVESAGGGWSLTADGLLAAERMVRKHRIWELYLTRRLDLPSDHVHRDAEAMEHALSDDAVRDLEKALGFPTVDPHGQPIPPQRPEAS